MVNAIQNLGESPPANNNKTNEYFICLMPLNLVKISYILLLVPIHSNLFLWMKPPKNETTSYPTL